MANIDKVFEKFSSEGKELIRSGDSRANLHKGCQLYNARDDATHMGYHTVSPAQMALVHFLREG